MELNFYTRFRDAHPNCKVGLRAFEKLKPFLREKIEGSKHMCLPETCGDFGAGGCDVQHADIHEGPPRQRVQITPFHIVQLIVLFL